MPIQRAGLWVGLRCPAAGGAAAPPYHPKKSLIGLRCPAASGAAAPPYREKFAVASPMNLMHAAKVRPVLRPRHQPGADRIFPHVLPFLRVTFVSAQPMMKSARLKGPGAGKRFGETIFPEGNPAFDGESQLTRCAEQVQMVGHQQVIAHQPGRRRVFPDIMERTLDGGLSQPASAFVRADGQEKPIRSSQGETNALRRCAAIVGRRCCAAACRRSGTPTKAVSASGMRPLIAKIRGI